MAMVKDQLFGKTMRKSYAKYQEILEMPNLLKIQKDSYQWFLNEGLQEVFRDVGTITDFSGKLELSFLDFTMKDAPKYTVEECVEGLRAKIRSMNDAMGIPNTLKDFGILEDEFKAASDNLYLMTDDGSYGEHGFVTVKLQQLLESGRQYDEVLAIGPIPMMKFVSKTTEPFGVKTIVSLNPIMVDGTGMCGGCRVTVGGETKFACVDGPDFDGHQVDYAELMSRNGVYRDREAQVAKEHVCRMEAMGKALI